MGGKKYMETCLFCAFMSKIYMKAQNIHVFMYFSSFYPLCHNGKGYDCLAVILSPIYGYAAIASADLAVQLVTIQCPPRPYLAFQFRGFLPMIHYMYNLLGRGALLTLSLVCRGCTVRALRVQPGV